MLQRFTRAPRLFKLANATRIVILLAFAAGALAQSRSVRLSDLSWKEAAAALSTETVVMIPLGAQSKEHGPHLKLANDWLMAEYLSAEVMKRTSVATVSTLNYGFYPAFVEYPGSAPLSFNTARDVVVELCRGFAHFDPRRIYILNTGVSTVRPLEATAMELAKDASRCATPIFSRPAKPSRKRSEKQKEGAHADEIETSEMLYIAPESVNMKIREEIEQHVGKCWHCIDHFCRMAKVIEVLRGMQPLSEADAAPLRKKLGIEAPKRAFWKR